MRFAPKYTSAFRAGPVHGYAGIGNPERFFAMLRANGIELTAHPYPDHHWYESKDFATGDDYPILMTEKDAVKCARIANGRMWYVPVTAQLSQVDAARLLGVVGSAVAGGGKAGA